MPDASDTMRRRRERTLYANKVIQETYQAKGYTSRITYEGQKTEGLITYPVYNDMRDGTTVTTESERTAYVNSVPNREPDPPTGIIATGAGGAATVYFTPPVYTGVFPITSYIVKVSPGGQEIQGTESPIIVPDLTTGTSYTFTLCAVNKAGRSLPSVTSDPIDVIGVPSRPLNPVGSPGNAEVLLSFTESANDGGSAVIEYTAISNPGELTGAAASSPITIAGLTNGVPYTFTIIATNANGDSQPSLASAPVIPKTVPDAPTNVTAVRGNTQVTVEFQAPLANGGDPITSYTATSSPGEFTASGSSSPIIVTGLTNGTPYTFTVVATNSVGNSAPSSASNSATPATTPDAPTAVSAAAGNAQAVVSFSAPASNGGSTIVSYTVTSPDGITASGGASPITVTGLTNNTAYTFTVVATNAIGNSAASSASNSVTPIAGNVPTAPLNVSAIPGQNLGTVFWSPPSSNGGSPITGYTVTSSPGEFTASGASSPLQVLGLTNGVAYTFSVVATNINGYSNPGISNLITAGAPAPPTLTSTFPTVNDITVSFTPSSNGTSAITNYRYSLNGGPYTSLSPADAVSPITISGLSPTTTYTITLKATNANGDSLASNTLTATTYTTMHIQSFTSVGTTSWTAPAGVTFVQYLITGGGGGGGACYSKIDVIGDVPLAGFAPSPTAYWINNTAGNIFYGYLFKGTSRYSTSTPTQISVLTSPTSQIVPFLYPPTVPYPYNRWYKDQIVYWTIGQGYPLTSGYFAPYYTINSTYSNNISGGGGGGAGGRLRFSFGTSIYSVTPGNTYSVTVGAGGAGGVATATTEAAGSPGGASSFDTIVAEGGSGGSPSRLASNTTNGYNKGGRGGQSGGNFFGGEGGQGLGNGQNNYGLYNRGASGGFGGYLDFDGNGAKTYVQGGQGGVPNTVTTTAAPANLGRGGAGTGATLNSFANGMDGGSGIVILKWYT